jgi:hypothetical protein
VEATKFVLGIGNGEDQNILNSSKKCTFVFLLSHTIGTADVCCAGGGFNVRDICSLGGGIGLKTQTKSGIITLDAEDNISFTGEWLRNKAKRRGRDFDRLSGLWSSILYMLKVLYIRRDGIMGKIIHTFIKTCMECNFDTKHFHIIPGRFLVVFGRKRRKITLRE